MNTSIGAMTCLENLFSSPVQKLNETSAPNASPLSLLGAGVSAANIPPEIRTASSPTTSVVNNQPLQQAKPAYVFQNERVQHRYILEYIAKGYTDAEIAKLTGFSAPMIGYVRKQPRYQEPLLDEVKRKMSEDSEVVEFIKKNVVSAVETLAVVMNDDKARNSDRIAAAEALLNRRYGKPNQPINRNNGVDLNALSDNELAQMLPETSGSATSKVV